MMSERIKRVAIIVVTVSVVSIITGCSNVKEYLGEQMKQKSGILETPDYVVFKEYQERGLLDTEGYYSDLMTDTSEVGDSDVKVTFAENNNLRVQYFTDSALRNEVDKSDFKIKKGNSIYAVVEISDDIFSSMYDFSGFKIFEYDENGDKKESSLTVNKDDNVYTLKLPEDYIYSSISIEPIGMYHERNIKLNDYYSDEEDQQHLLTGTWIVNDKEYTDDSVEISPVTSYIISYEYDSNEYFYLSSDPECYYSNNIDGVVIFKQRDPDDETVDYSVELHKYITVTLISDLDRNVKVNGKDKGKIEANSELVIDQLKYGDTVTIETDKEWSGLENNRELILTKTESMSNGGKKYIFIVPEKGGEFTFDPKEYSYDYGKIRFKCFGQVIDSTQVLAKGSKIYYEQESAVSGYWLPGKDSEHFIEVGDENETKDALRSIHFTPMVDVSVKLPQPKCGGSVIYSLNGKRISGDNCSTYSGAVITMKFKPWEGWISNFAGEISYNVGNSKSQTVTADKKNIDEVFYEDDNHKPELKVTLEKSVGNTMKFTLDASGYRMDVESYAGGWQVSDIFNQNPKKYNILDNSQIIVENKKIGTELPIKFTMSNRAIQSGTAVRMKIVLTDSDNNSTSETRYIDDLSEPIEPVNIYSPGVLGTSKTWFKSVDITIGVVSINRFCAPDVSSNIKFTVKNIDTNETLTNGYAIEDSQKVAVTISPKDGYYVTGKKVSNDVYFDTMTYADYKKNVGDIVANHPAEKYICINLDASDSFANYKYKLDGKDVSGKIKAKNGKKLELTYEITDSTHKLKEAHGGVVFGLGSSYTNATENITVTSSLDGKTLTRQDFGIDIE